MKGPIFLILGLFILIVPSILHYTKLDVDIGLKATLLLQFAGVIYLFVGITELTGCAA